MSFSYTESFVNSGLTYSAYKQQVADILANPPVNEEAAKLRSRMHNYLLLMNYYDNAFILSQSCIDAVQESADFTWILIAEGWCTDAAFNVPVMAAIERALPEKVTLRVFFRDENPELIDANLTDGGRSIPKLIILDKDLQEVANWGPRPAELNALVKEWRAEGLSMPQIFPKMQVWYDLDASITFQEEIKFMLSEVNTPALSVA